MTELLLDMMHYHEIPDFKEYVDRYCKSRSKTVEDALQDEIVRAYLEYLLNRD